MKRKAILIVDDEPRLVRLVKVNLLASGYTVSTASDGKTAIEMLESASYDLLILDIMLPGPFNGFEACKRIREFSDIPIIMLTGRAREQDRIRGFDAGADDYITKPFSVEELLLRVKAILRRTHPSEEFPKGTTYNYGDLVINFAQRRVFLRGREVRLTATEYQILYHLGCHAGKVITHEDLLTRVWGTEYRNELHYLRNYISSLRKKIEDDPGDPQYILGKHGIGYQLAIEDQ
ncbi:response regulator transcription factor [Pelotomaculum propionicicum]|uniref:Stage 0 sporulation protein A homolog n=1 Tax=Pelotomaculum propionicicum TaxID=258475 RepID=A0A4Y7RQJ6_9FIRM|nr:response regulator transcription factor [Pelotomaculum propionicicum]NLI11285.1 response regulator transcription factor [Peptococcaceae bacterium]TEB10989.1 Transcriptional regulatory protein WalR [Pelotomaculum propionicicum]